MFKSFKEDNPRVKPKADDEQSDLFVHLERVTPEGDKDTDIQISSSQVSQSDSKMKRSLRSILSKDLRRSIKEQISTKKNNDSKNSDTFVSSIIVLNDVSLKESDLDPIIEVTPLQKTSS